MVINMKMFSRDDLHTLFDFLGDKLIDEKRSMERVVGRRKDGKSRRRRKRG